jgi:hypothetical protein
MNYSKQVDPKQFEGATVIPMFNQIVILYFKQFYIIRLMM